MYREQRKPYTMGSSAQSHSWVCDLLWQQNNKEGKVGLTSKPPNVSTLEWKIQPDHSYVNAIIGWFNSKDWNVVQDDSWSSYLQSQAPLELQNRVHSSGEWSLILFPLLPMFYFLRLPKSVFFSVRFTLSCQKIRFVQLGACDFSDKNSKRGLFSLLLAIWYLHVPVITNLYSLTFSPFCLFLLFPSIFLSSFPFSHVILNNLRLNEYESMRPQEYDCSRTERKIML